MRVAIAGAGRVGQAIAAELLDEGHDIVLLEKSSGVVADVKRHLAKAKIFTVDACEVRSLSPTGLDASEAAIAATGDDQVNLVFSLLASQEFGVPRVVARVNDPRNGWLFTEAWGVDEAVSTPSLLAANAIQKVGSGAMVRLQSLQNGKVDLLSAEILESHPARDKAIRDLGLPSGVTVAAVLREGVVVPPDPDQILGIGDEILIVAECDCEQEVARLLLGEAHLIGDARP